MINSFALLGDNPPLLLNGGFGRMLKITILMHDLRIIFFKIYFPWILPKGSQFIHIFK